MSPWLRFRLWVGRITEWDPLAVKALLIFFAPITLIVSALFVEQGVNSFIDFFTADECDAACEKANAEFLDDLLGPGTQKSHDQILDEILDE